MLNELFGRFYCNDAATTVLDRMDEEEIREAIKNGRLDDYIWEEMDSALIYWDDQWAMIETYCSPRDADFEDAWDSLSGDLYDNIMEVYNNER